MLLYNNPGRTGYTLSANLVERLAREVPNIVGMKDSSGDMTQTEEFIRRTSDIGFKVFGGKDTLIFGAMVHGAAGCVATTANFIPELVTSIYNLYMQGDLDGARKAQFKLNPIRLSMDKASFPVATGCGKTLYTESARAQAGNRSNGTADAHSRLYRIGVR